ncbi:MFS transporter [Novosphingobium rosa]|uniref:MFS transporter n=1 Tax=Novosphingobium rosa TaxID=76978 RepID=UPI00082BBCC4|nr:MFS transporter [Novosphingobium rosa]
MSVFSSRHARWWIIALVSLGTVLNYLARSTLSTVAPTLKQVFAMSTEQYSYVVMAFQAAYTVAQPLAGLVLDVLGSKIGIGLFAACWGLANMAHALATGWPSLALFRGLLGGAEASAMPGGLKVVAEWFPPRERSVATGWFNMGTSIGNMLAPPLVAFCILTWGWRSSFLITGAMSIVWAAAWFALYRKPEGAQAHAQADRADAMTWRGIVAERRFWSIALPRFLAEPAWQTFNFFIPLYLTSVWHLDLVHVAMWAWLPFVAADLGSVLGGYVAAWLIGGLGLSVINSRKVVVTLGALLMVGPASIGLVHSAQMAIALFCIGGFAHQMLSGALLTLAADVYPGHAVGRVAGLAGSSAWIGGFLFTALIGQSADRFGYDPLFAALAGLDWLGAGILWLMLRHR